MGHKVHPKVFRLGTTTTWPSRWFARDAEYRKRLLEDLSIREFLVKELRQAAVSGIDIDRSRGAINITLHSAKPGLVIGRSGAGIEDMKTKVMKKFFPGRAKEVQLHLSVQEVGRPSLEATLVAQSIVDDLVRRVRFRRALKQAIQRVRKAGALGVKVAISGRLNGAEIARREWLSWGKIPLTNLRADIDYAQDMALTTTGTIGVKVWIYRGDVFEQDRLSQYQPTTPTRPRRGSVGRPGIGREGAPGSRER